MPRHQAPEIEELGSDMDEDNKGKTKREAPPVTSSPPKQRRAEGAVTEDLLRQLLADTQAAILRAQSETLITAIDQLERKQDKRFETIEQDVRKTAATTEGLETKLIELAARVTKVEEGSTVASSEGGLAGDQGRRKLTLVVGGFPKDSRRDVIIKRVNEVLQQQGLMPDTDESPFCTGPRRTVALLPFRVRANETTSDAKNRMHRVLAGVVNARANIVGASRPMWCGVSKTPAKRLRSSHCGFLRKIVAAVDDDFLQHAEHDYGKGSTWLGQTLVGCATDPPPNIDKYKLFKVPGKPGHWLNVSGLAAEMKVQFSEIEKAIHKCVAD